MNMAMTGSLDIGPFWQVREGEGPLIGVALHAGHNLRAELVPLLAISEAERFREEDPYSDYWTLVCGTQILTLRSRFEVDLNRERDKAVYLTPQDAWGLRVWSDLPDPKLVDASLMEHDRFYAMLKQLLEKKIKEYGHVVVLDFHSYNQYRGGPGSTAADSRQNPEINIGTGSMPRERWEHVVDGFIETLRSVRFLDHTLDVRENVKFRGRYLASFVHEHFPEKGCAIAIEVKKFYMDEWTGQADTRQIIALREVFRHGARTILTVLSQVA